MLEKEIEALIAEIRVTFEDISYPKPRGYPPPVEVADLLGKKWHELSVSDVASNYWFFLFSNEEFRYFLPAYLVIMLQNTEQLSESFVIDYLFRHLCQDYTNLPRQDLCELFSKKQQQVILKFLDIFENVWLSSENIEKRVSRANRQEKDRVRKGLEKKRQETMDLLEKAKQYWQQCE